MSTEKIMAMVFVVAALCMLNTRAAYVEDEYPAYFSYSGSTGPEFWGSLSPNYTKCSNGRAQSPINIVNRDAVLNRSLSALNIQFRDSVNATLINYGFKVEILFRGDAGALVFGGKTYALSEIHWHTLSDHRVDGSQFTAELHMVHSAADSSRAVVSVLLQTGQSDPIVTKIDVIGAADTTTTKSVTNEATESNPTKNSIGKYKYSRTKKSNYHQEILHLSRLFNQSPMHGRCYMDNHRKDWDNFKGSSCSSETSIGQWKQEQCKASAAPEWKKSGGLPRYVSLNLVQFEYK